MGLAVSLDAKLRRAHTSAMRAARNLVLLLLFAFAEAYGDTPRNAGSKYFDEADRILAGKWIADVSGLAERGWAAVQAAGPRYPRFLGGVYTTARIFRVLRQDRRVESVYSEANAKCEGSTPE